MSATHWNYGTYDDAAPWTDEAPAIACPHCGGESWNCAAADERGYPTGTCWCSDCDGEWTTGDTER